LTINGTGYEPQQLSSERTFFEEGSTIAAYMIDFQLDGATGSYGPDLQAISGYKANS
jgi:hypothetical protein